MFTTSFMGSSGICRGIAATAFVRRVRIDVNAAIGFGKAYRDHRDTSCYVTVAATRGFVGKIIWCE